MSERQLYRLVAGKQTGPYPPDKLRPLVADGRISRLDRFSYDGVDWLSADHFPELIGKPASSTVAPAAMPESRLGSVTAEVPALLPPDAATPADRSSSHARKTPWRWVLGAACTALLITAATVLSWGSRILVRPIDVTDEFEMLADSLEGYEGKRVLVRGVYLPHKLTKTSQSAEHAITFRSESGCVLNGDCAYRLTLLTSKEMAQALRQVADRLAAEQPAAVSFLCQERRNGDRRRAYGLIDHITFCEQIPEEPDDKGFLRVEQNGTVREY
jgi:hypothetical protein